MGDFGCDLCSKTYLRLNELIAHRKRYHTTCPNYNCPRCDEKFVMKRDLTIHRKTFHGLERLKCDICGKECFSKPSLIYHLKTHARPYHCELCQRSFEDKNRFAKHMHASHDIETTETESVVINQSSTAMGYNTHPMTVALNSGANSKTSQNDVNANQSNPNTSFTQNMTNPEVKITECCTVVFDATSESDTEESYGGNYHIYIPSAEKSQISMLSTDSVDKLNTNCLQTNMPEFMSFSELHSDKVKKSSSDMNPPPTEIICIEDTQNTTVDSVSNGEKIDNSTQVALPFVPPPEYIKVWQFGFKESVCKKFEPYSSSCCSTDTEHDNKNNTGASSKDANWLEFQRETCLDTEIKRSVPYIDLDNLSPSADDRQINLDSDEHNSDLEIQWEEQCNRCHITFTDTKLFNNHKAGCCAAVVQQYSNNLKLVKKNESKDNHLEGMATGQLIDLTEESTTDNSSSMSNEILMEQVSLRGNTVENCYLETFDPTSQEENSKQCTFCDDVFKDMSTLLAHQEKCLVTLTTKRLSKNREITHTCEICNAVFKDSLSYAVHEMRCSPKLGTIKVYTSQLESSSTMELDFNEMPINSSQTDLLTNSETSSSFANTISVVSIDLTQDRTLTDQTRKNLCDESLNQHKKTGLIVNEIQNTSNLEVFCLHCAMKFQNRNEHHEHELSHELMANTPLGITYICIVCGNSYDMTGKFIQHVSIHEESQDVAKLEKCCF